MFDLETPGLNARQKQLLQTLKTSGLDITQQWVQDEVTALAAPESIRSKTNAEKSERIIREAESVLKSLYYPSSSIQQKCKDCGRVFGTNYVYNKHCSPECLQSSLHKMGITWDPTKSDAERFCGEPPASIKPEVLARLKEWARKILAYDEITKDTLELKPRFGTVQTMLKNEPTLAGVEFLKHLEEEDFWKI
jgi:hypothetical protein